MLQHTLNNTEPVKLLGCDVDSQCAGEGFSCLDSSCLQGSIAIAGAEPEDRCRQGKTDPSGRQTDNRTLGNIISDRFDGPEPGDITGLSISQMSPTNQPGRFCGIGYTGYFTFADLIPHGFNSAGILITGDFQLHGAIISHVTILSVLSVECRTDATGCS